VTGDEIRVKVREEHVPDLQPVFRRILQVPLDVALWIHDDGGAAGRVAYEIGGMGEAVQVVLFQEHERRAIFA